MGLRILDQVVGHRTVIEKLLRIVEQGRLPPSWLFVGPQNQGKKLVAFGIVQAILCEQSRRACGSCPSCQRVVRRQSEGLILVEPQGPIIKIETARQIINDLSLSALGRGRVVLIDEAEKLSAQSANALLKSVEEPPLNTHFIFIARSRDSVLPTLRSRSQIVGFGSLTRDELSAVGRENTDFETRKRAVQILIEMLATENDRASTSSRSGGLRIDAITQWREQVSDRDMALLYIRLWLEFIRDSWMLKSGMGCDSEFVEQFVEQLQVLSYQPFEKLAFASRAILQAERDLQANSDVNLTFENLVYQNAGF